MTTHLIDRTKINTVVIGVLDPKWFDPVEFISDHVVEQKLRARVLSSMAWYTDVLLVGATRGLFYKMFEDMQLAGTIDSYNEFLTRMKLAGEAEKNVVEQGYSDDGSLATIKRLLTYREQMHDAANGVNARHIRPNVEQLLANEKQQRTTGLTVRKLKALAEAEAADNEGESAEEIFKLLMAREEDRLKQAYTRRLETVPVITALMSFIDRTHVDTDEVELQHLPLDMQRRIVEQLHAAVTRSLADLSTDSKVDVMEFLTIRRETKPVLAALKALAEHDAYVEHDEVVDQAQPIDRDVGPTERADHSGKLPNTDVPESPVIKRGDTIAERMASANVQRGESISTGK